jgi:surface protein
MFNVPSFFGFKSGTAEPFEFTINTANLSAGGTLLDTQFKLPLTTSTGLNCTVYWGDGTYDNITNHLAPEVTHTYASSGIYTVKITGSLLGWGFNNGGDRLKMLNVSKWAGLNISVSSGFYGCTNLTASATDAPLITTTSLVNYFHSCTNFNGNIGSWDVSNVTIFLSMFLAASAFNNGNNDSIKNWVINTTSNVSFTAMFQSANSFNQPIGTWDVSKVTNFSSMFQNNTAFNNGGSSNINNWIINTTSNVTMPRMFSSASAFNQNIGSWNVSNVADFTEFMAGKTAANYSAANLSSIYDQWSTRPVKPNLSINFGTIDYFAASEPNKLILTNAPNLWTIIDGNPI